MVACYCMFLFLTDGQSKHQVLVVLTITSDIAIGHSFPVPQLSGFPLHLRYSDIQHIVSTVESTGIHLCENEHVEYALAVYVHPYPDDVLSVWLYTASLIPK